MNQDLVSVVIPAFNSEQYITTCLDSVLGQTYQNLEVILVDDGSTGKTVQLVSEYDSGRIQIHSQENSGVASARNHGVQKASGEWIAFIDSDDIWLPDKLQKQLDHCSCSQWSHTDSYFLGGVYEKHTRASDLSEKHSGDIFTRLLIENLIGTSCVVIKKAIFEEFGGFSTSYRALEDWELWIRVASKYDICYFEEPLVYYRVHSASISRSTRNTLPYHINLIDYIFVNNQVDVVKYAVISDSMENRYPSDHLPVLIDFTIHK